ncbi:PREDICTED: uncharacterized protein LOC106122009 isoform X2 [Papilio xuthus]|uniref:Uncharacterized protein LOC106122009 isoform X2 n=1 Tax=Papilio xuthus TaxID=66420 RepID=A0AAJ7EDU2_PAPXU|nr:PREDICTED: uncharacterized protein LOC106122009 isoform X2 [Papilio xuthus]
MASKISSFNCRRTCQCLLSPSKPASPSFCGSGTRSSSPTPERAVSLPNLDKSIPILKPEIVIEERRWCPYPMIIRHYIEKPKSSEKFTALKKWYKCNQEKRKKKAEQKRDMQRVLAEKERIERERCLKELRRLHSHHQSLCCRSQSLPTFSKSSKPAKSCKISYKTRATTAKDKCKLKKLKKKPKKEKCRQKSSPFGCIKFCCNVICCCTILTIVALAIIVFVL